MLVGMVIPFTRGRRSTCVQPVHVWVSVDLHTGHIAVTKIFTQRVARQGELLRIGEVVGGFQINGFDTEQRTHRKWL